MMTSDPSIFACGDCAEKISFFGGRPSCLKLASIAQTEARIAGANLFGIKRQNYGTVGVWSHLCRQLRPGHGWLDGIHGPRQGLRCRGGCCRSPQPAPGRNAQRNVQNENEGCF